MNDHSALTTSPWEGEREQEQPAVVKKRSQNAYTAGYSLLFDLQITDHHLHDSCILRQDTSSDSLANRSRSCLRRRWCSTYYRS
jgi:hypothetical protein